MALVDGGFLHYTDMKKFIKNLLRNCWSDLKYFHRNVLWVILFKKCSGNFDSSLNMALVNGSFFALYRHEEILKKSSSQKPLVRF